jgi:hypothetical protein
MGYVQTRNAQHKKKTVNRYTSEGRAEIHKNLGINTDTMIWLMQNPVKRNNISYNMSLPVWRAIFLPCSKKPYSAGFAAMQ